MWNFFSSRTSSWCLLCYAELTILQKRMYLSIFTFPAIIMTKIFMIVICEPIIYSSNKSDAWHKILSFNSWPNMSMVSTVAFNITELKLNLVLALLCRVNYFTKDNVTLNFYISIIMTKVFMIVICEPRICRSNNLMHDTIFKF